MALIEIKVPSVGESVTEALLAQWFKKDGDAVRKDEPLFVLETDKVTLEVTAEAAGVLSVKVPDGTTVKVGTVVGAIDTISAAGAAEIESAVVQVIAGDIGAHVLAELPGRPQFGVEATLPFRRADRGVSEAQRGNSGIGDGDRFAKVEGGVGQHRGIAQAQGR